MVHVCNEGKFNNNSYLIDGMQYSQPGNMAVYVIENEGERIMIDTSDIYQTRKILKKLKEFGLFPVQKLLLTHSHWDHSQGWEKLKKTFRDLEIYASENAKNNLKHPEIMNDVYEFKVPPLEEFIPVKEGDIIDINGLELKVFDFFGHTCDSIAVVDEKNKNIFVGDGIIVMNDKNSRSPNVIMPPDFNESLLLQTFNKLRKIGDQLNSISLAHFGVYTNEDFNEIVNDMENFYFQSKNALIQWYSENPSSEYLASKYRETFIPKSKLHTKENLIGLDLMMKWIIEGLKSGGFIS